MINCISRFRNTDPNRRATKLFQLIFYCVLIYLVIMGCPICLDSLFNGEIVLAMHCGHAVHRECLMQYVRTSHLCPTCRRRFSRTWRLFLDENVAPNRPIQLDVAGADEIAGPLQNMRLDVVAERAADEIFNELIGDVFNAANVDAGEVQQNVAAIEPIMRQCFVRLVRCDGEIIQRRVRRQVQRLHYNRVRCSVCHRSFTTFDIASSINFADFVCGSINCIRR